MVSLSTGLKGAGVLAALALGYVALKNADKIGAGIGSSVGGGLASGFKGLSDSFLNAFNIFGSSNGITQAQKDLISSHGIETVDGINTKEDKIVQSGGIPKGNDTPAAKVFQPFVERGLVSYEFAQDYSFLPEAPKGVLDVTDNFRFIAQTGGNPVNVKPSATNTTAYGGFSSAEEREKTLVGMIEENARKYGESFG